MLPFPHPFFGKGATFEPEAEAYFAAMTVQPSDADKAKLNRFIATLKLASVLAKLTSITPFGAFPSTNKQAAYLDIQQLSNPWTDQRDTGSQNFPTLLNYGGVQTGSSSPNMNYLLKAARNYFGLRQGSLLLFSSQSGSSISTQGFGSAASGSSYLGAGSFSQVLQGNSGNEAAFSVSSNGLYGVNRDGADANSLWYNGTQQTTFNRNNSDTNITSVPLYIGVRSGYRDTTTKAVATAAVPLTASDYSTINNALNQLFS